MTWVHGQAIKKMTKFDHALDPDNPWAHIMWRYQWLRDADGKWVAVDIIALGFTTWAEEAARPWN
jgi:hypothetical protein